MRLPESHQNQVYPWRREGDDFLLTIRLTPRGGQDRIDGIEQRADGAVILKARVRAVPECGAANAALIDLIARALKFPKGRISLEAGASARIKCLRLFQPGDVCLALLFALSDKQS